MTAFGWITVFMWAFITIGVARGDNSFYTTLLAVFMLVGTLAWGTGSL